MRTERFYAVKRGNTPGVYTSLNDFNQAIQDYEYPSFKSDLSKDDAYDFLFGSFGSRKNSLSVVEELKLTTKYSNWPSTLVCYTDGSKKNEKSSCGFIAVSKDEIVYEYGNTLDLDMTHIHGEFISVVHAIQFALDNHNKRVFIFYDYEQIRDVLTYNDRVYDNFIENYKKFIYDSLKKIEIQFIKVKAHHGNKFNEYVNHMVYTLCS